MTLTEEGARWLEEARERIRADARAVFVLFPAAGRACGRGPVDEPPGWTVDRAVRVELLRALPREGPLLFELYAHGDSAERLAVLAALPALDEDGQLREAGLPIVRDALRTSDTRLIGAAMNSYAADHLPDDAYRQAVLKCVFTGVPLATVAGLDRRADAELARMMADFARERLLAGRAVPADIWPVLERHPETLDGLRTFLNEIGAS